MLATARGLDAGLPAGTDHDDEPSGFEQELWAAQQEVTADWDLQRDPRRRPWSGASRMVTSGIDGSKDNADKPPDNSPKPGKAAGGKPKARRENAGGCKSSCLLCCFALRR